MVGGVVGNRHDGDTWDITTSVGSTALFVAAARALEAQRTEPLSLDPYAEVFCRAVGGEWADVLDGVASGSHGTQLLEGDFGGYFVSFQGARTKYFDAYFTKAIEAGVRQVVIIAAGLDSRAYRLPWADGTVVFEIDQPKVLEFKLETLRAHRAEPAARHVAVPIDLRQDWPTALRQAGFDASVPTAWLAEGLLPYLPAAAQDLLFERIQELSATDSRIAVEAFGPEYFDEDYQRRRREDMERLRAATASTGRGMTDVAELFFNEPRADVAGWLHDHGWDVRTETSAQLMARHKPDLPPDLQHPASVFVEGRRLSAG